MPAYILAITCPDGPGIIHAISGGLLEVEANVLEQEQYSDLETGLFFARTRFESPEDDLDRVRRVLADRTAAFTPELSLRLESAHRRALILVSQYDHCLLDLLYRWDAGELPLDIAGVVSNHEICRPIVERYGLPFDHLPVTPDTKAEQESRLLEIVEERSARSRRPCPLMQILSEDVCRELERAGDQHRRLVPARLQGSAADDQAYARGVKLIGATAYFVTSDSMRLDHRAGRSNG